MSDQKRHWKKHICAAKEWLGRAEKSLDADNSLRSDLNLMLAQAELQRAKESGQKKTTEKFRRSLPAAIFAALLVFAGIWAGVFPLLAEKFTVVPEKPGTFAVQERPVLSAPPSVSLPAKAADPVPGSASLEIAEHQPPAPPPPVPMPEKQQAAAAVSVPEQPETREAAVPAVKVPTEKVQKLMREAGKTLRAQ